MAKSEPKGGARARRRRASNTSTRGRGRAREAVIQGGGSRPVQTAHATVSRTPRGLSFPRAENASGSAATPGGAPRPLLPLTADVSATLLTLAGAQHAALRDVLQAWGDAQDHAANRVWRRPGGLTRLAGL